MAGPFKRRATVVLADDHRGTLDAASEILSEDLEVLAAVNNGTMALQAISLFCPDVVVLDIAMPGSDGFQTARQVRELGLPVRIVFLTITEDWDYVRAAAGLGASYVLKRRMNDDLLTATKEALAGRLFVSPMLATSSSIVNQK